jgi:stage IV sporulation protein FB
MANLMLLPEPRPTRWDLHWRTFGADFRVHPLFWASSALMGLYYYQHPTDGGVGVFVFWMIAAFVSILLHELGHVFAARLFGVRGRVYVSGLGGWLLNLAELKRWKRVLVLLAGPLTSLLIVALLHAVTLAPLPRFVTERGWTDPIGKGMVMLAEGNFWWGVLNLLPLWPLDGGQAVVEAAEGLLGRRGVALAGLLSVLVTGALTAWMVLEMRLRLINRFDPLFQLHLEEFAVLTVYCFILWIKGFRLLWGDSEPLDETTKSGRAA